MIRGMREVIRRWFPGAAPLSEIRDQYLERLAAEFGYPKSRLLFASCICPDELNFPAAHFQGAFSNSFSLGGLGGLPYTGLTGMKAFQSHIPEDGGGLILFGPHVGVDAAGRLGAVTRPGQTGPTPTCGALVSVLERMQAGVAFDQSPAEFHDLQARVIERLLHEGRQVSPAGPETLLEGLEILFQTAHDWLADFLAANQETLGGRPVFLLGGILINTSDPAGNYLEPRLFKRFP